MKIKLCMIYREVLAKRLERKRGQLAELEIKMNENCLTLRIQCLMG